MRIILLILLGLIMSETSRAEEISAIDVFKQQPQVQQLLAKHPTDKNQISFDEVQMGGQCGFVGCTWNKLVSMVITSQRANAPSLTILAVVSGNTPARGAKPQVRFVELKDMDPAIWQTTL